MHAPTNARSIVMAVVDLGPARTTWVEMDYHRHLKNIAVFGFHPWFGFQMDPVYRYLAFK